MFQKRYKNKNGKEKVQYESKHTKKKFLLQIERVYNN